MTAYDLWQYAETKHGLENLWIGIDSNGFIRICRHGSILEVIKPTNPETGRARLIHHP